MAFANASCRKQVVEIAWKCRFD